MGGLNAYTYKENWKTTTFIDKKATETHFKQYAANDSLQVIHISTHGFYFPQSLNITDKGDRSRNKRNMYRIADNPLLRSGLVFSGANFAWNGENCIDDVKDGILTSYEIANLNLNAELVVLSACNTGLGDIVDGEGVYGLLRAFRLAGVKSMIVSLWEVPDNETVELMTEFYSNLTSGKDKKTAFTTAQLKLRKLYPNNSEKWAGFILIE